MAVDHERRPQRVLDALGDPCRLAQAGDLLEQDRELVSAEARDRVRGTQAGAQPLAHGDQHLVARIVAEAVVDLLEPVEVEQQHGDDLIAPSQARERVLEPVREQRAVRQVCQRIVECLARQLVDPLLVGSAQGGVLDHQRSLERELVDELALLGGPVAALARLGADDEAERPLGGQQRKRDVGAKPEQRDELGRDQLAGARVLDEDRLRLARGAPPEPELARAGLPTSRSRATASNCSGTSSPMYSIRSSASARMTLAC